MHRPDRFDEVPEFDDELPDLPIPRPGEGPAEAAAPQPITPPRLGGGASYTAARDTSGEPPRQRPQDEVPGEEPQLPVQPEATEAEQVEAERFSWEIAARLTAGMLANPARSHASVKDAMAMFHQFLHEMHAYERIAAAADRRSDRDRRESAREYFQTVRAEAQAAKPAASTPKQAPPRPKPKPAQPAPQPGYQALPPNARSRYLPGSMAGAPPEPTDGDSDASSSAA